MIKLGHYNDALDLVSPQLIKYPQDPLFLEVMATCYDKLEMPEKARALFAKLLLISPGNSAAKQFLTK